MERTHRWQARSLATHLAAPQQQAMYGIVHGGVDPAMRAESARAMGALPFDGLAVGGSLGRDRAEMLTMLQLLLPKLRVAGGETSGRRFTQPDPIVIIVHSCSADSRYPALSLSCACLSCAPAHACRRRGKRNAAGASARDW